MWPRLVLPRELLSERGSIWMLDDNEVHRARMAMDEIFGAENFVVTCVWHKMDSPKNTAEFFSEDHDYVLVCAKAKTDWHLNLLPRFNAMIARYKNPRRRSARRLAAERSGGTEPEHSRALSDRDAFGQSDPTGLAFLKSPEAALTLSLAKRLQARGANRAAARGHQVFARLAAEQRLALRVDDRVPVAQRQPEEGHRLDRFRSTPTSVTGAPGRRRTPTAAACSTRLTRRTPNEPRDKRALRPDALQRFAPTS